MKKPIHFTFSYLPEFPSVGLGFEISFSAFWKRLQDAPTFFYVQRKDVIFKISWRPLLSLNVERRYNS